MRWLILDAAGEIVRVLNDFDPDLEDMTGCTAVEREVPEGPGWLWDAGSAEYVVNQDYHLGVLRAERDVRLVASDRYMFDDFPGRDDPELHGARLTYRQALRDLPETTVDFSEPVWPEVPA